MSRNATLEDLLFMKAKAKGRPARAVLELTPLCNFNCDFCYIKHTPAEAEKAGGLKDTSFWLNLIPELKNMGVLVVTIIGGEPLLYPGFKEIYSELMDNGFLVNVTTNGSLITDEILTLFQNKPPRYVTISLYGSNPESYKRATGNENGFAKTISGIEALRSAGIAVKLNHMVTPENEDDLEEIFRIKEKYDLPLLSSSYCFPSMRRANTSKFHRLDPEMSARKHMAIKKTQKKDEYSAYCNEIAQGTFEKNEQMHIPTISCYGGSATFWINWKGSMMPCGFLENLSVPVHEGCLEDAWAELKGKVSAVRTSSKCAECSNREICSVCSAAMYCETGDFEHAPEYLCQMTEEIVKIANENNA